MYKLYNFHLLNNQSSRSPYNIKISPEPAEPVFTMPQQPTLKNPRGKPLQISRNFLSIISNAAAGKGCSSCGGGR
jgi:hypothetical protein